jgi:uncharacterized protein with ParB-like and HNH nuclease domain
MENQLEPLRKELSVEDMTTLARQVKNWKVTNVDRWGNGDYPFFSIYAFRGKLEGITLDIESSSANSFSQWYRIRTSTELSVLGEYKQKEKKCFKGLVELFSDVHSRYMEDYFKERANGLDEARRLIGKI